MTGAIGPGTVLAGRYRLDDLLAESEGARFWRATDTILARSVAIHAVPSEDPRAPGLLEAARVSATVVDTHLLRVLDCEDEDGITWVVNEWGDGISLDLMLQQGTLPPSRAAWLAREVAEAIASGHAQGVAHGRLNPEAVLVTHAGAVKLIGYVVDASLQRPRPPDPLYGELDDREADVINLAGILYAALTGRWPGVAHSSVPAAPRESRRPLRPRQVRAGVPRTLDAICERVLHKEASLHAMPIETAHEIAAALADYVGDPTLSAPLDASGIHAEPAVSLHRPATPAVLGVTDQPVDADAALEESSDESRDSPEDASVEFPDDSTDDSTDEEATLLVVTDPAAGTGLPTQPSGDLPGTDQASEDPDDTQFYRVPEDDPTVAARHEEAHWSTASRVAAPPPDLPEAPERPLFADTERRVPAASRAASALASSGWADPPRTAGTAPGLGQGSRPAGSSAGDTGAGPGAPGSTGLHGAPGDGSDRPGDGGLGSWHGTGHGDDPAGFWPFDVDEEHDNDHHTGKEGRGWLRTAVVVGVLLVLLVVVAVLVYLRREDAATPAGEDSTTTSSSPSAQGGPLRLAGVSDFDPESDDPEENPADAPKAIDGDPATSWTTSTYFNDAKLGGLKSGVGLVVDLGGAKQPASVAVRFKGAPTSFEVYAADAGAGSAPTSLDGFEKVGARPGAGERATVRLRAGTETRYLLVWLTELPPVAGGYRGEIAEITARS